MRALRKAGYLEHTYVPQTLQTLAAESLNYNKHRVYEADVAVSHPI